jgi:response regulator RpfG family c-di-GMP phosphodiesterase
MKTHAQKGYDLLADSDRIVAKMGAIIAKTHHER